MSALGDTIVNALQELLRVLFQPIQHLLEKYGNGVVELVIGTPHPNAVFGAPTNGPWPGLYEYYWGQVMPLTLALYGLSIGLVIFLEATSHVFGGYHRSKLKKRAFTGLLGILSWWWVAALTLRFVGALGGFLAPDLSEVALFDSLSFAVLGVIGVVVSLSVDLVLVAMLALIYLVRQLGLYMYVLLMPILIVLWIPGVGPFAMVSRFMKRLAGFFFPVLFMTLPVAMLFRVGEILGHSLELSMGGFGTWLLALITPLVALFSPLVLFWQAGALFFMADRTSRRFSRNRLGTRVQRMQESAQVTAHSGRNFGRGATGQPAVSRSNQQLLSSGTSRSHSAGSRLRSSGSRLRSSGSKLRETFGSPLSGSDAAEQSRDEGRSAEAPGEEHRTLSGGVVTDEGDAERPDSATTQTALNDEWTDDSSDESSDDADQSDESSDERPWYIN